MARRRFTSYRNYAKFLHGFCGTIVVRTWWTSVSLPRSVRTCGAKRSICCPFISFVAVRGTVLPDHLLLDSVPNIGPLISCWELDEFKNCFRTSKILTLLYQQFSNLLILQRDMSGPRLGALSNNRRSGVVASSSVKLGIHIDYRCEYGRFPVSASCLTTSNPGLLSSSETRVSPGIKNWKKNSYTWVSLILESHWWHLFHKEVKSQDSTTWLRLQTMAISNRRLKAVFQMHLLAERFVFWGWWSGFLKTPISLFNSPTFFSLYIHSLCLCGDIDDGYPVTKIVL